MTVYTDLLRYRDLFGNLFRRDFQARYKGSALGILWSLANPLLLMAIYVLVFSLLWRVTDAIPHYPLYLLSGLAIWVFVSGALAASSRSLLDNANLIKKVRFPRQLAPFSTVATRVVTSCGPIAKKKTHSSRNASTRFTAGPAAITTIRFHTGWA